MRTYNLLLLQRLDGETAINMLEEQKEEEVWTHIKTCSVQTQMINFHSNAYVLFQRLPKVREHVRGSLEENTHSRG